MSEQMRDYFLEYVRYQDGKLFWKKTIHTKAKEGGLIGSPDPNGYLRFWMFRKQYSVHRVIFLINNGFLPSCIDHINGIVDDNRICNLREATLSQNQFNQKGRPSSISGVKGVHWHKTNNRWTANIRINGKLAHLGSFTNLNDAIAARHKAASEIHGVFFNAGLSPAEIHAAGVKTK